MEAFALEAPGEAAHPAWPLQHSATPSLDASRLRVAYVSTADPQCPRSWSGTHYRILRALRPHVAELVPIGPLHSRWRPALDLLGRLSRCALGSRLASETSPLVARDHTRQIADRLRGGNFDVVLASAASAEVAHLETALPIVHLSDATFATMRDYYPRFSRMHPLSQARAEAMERAALSKSRRMIYPSSWAAGSAVRDYGADPQRVAEIPFGANFDAPPPLHLTRSAPLGTCRLLFVGKDWRRKGGQIALDTLRALRARGLNATLTVVGCDRPAGIRDEHIEFIPHIDKRLPDGAARLQRIYREADVFLLPTRAECLGIVFCEAAAYGLPVVATATGGVPSAVLDGTSGVLLPPEAGGQDYAEAIAGILGSPERYLEMSAHSRHLYETRLNWETFGERCARILAAAASEAPRIN